jgi:hypothetical protein
MREDGRASIPGRDRANGPSGQHNPAEKVDRGQSLQNRFRLRIAALGSFKEPQSRGSFPVSIAPFHGWKQ